MGIGEMDDAMRPPERSIVEQITVADIERMLEWYSVLWCQNQAELDDDALCHKLKRIIHKDGLLKHADVN